MRESNTHQPIDSESISSMHETKSCPPKKRAAAPSRVLRDGEGMLRFKLMTHCQTFN
jgi:hypothetical protein